MITIKVLPKNKVVDLQEPKLSNRCTCPQLYKGWIFLFLVESQYSNGYSGVFLSLWAVEDITPTGKTLWSNCVLDEGNLEIFEITFEPNLSMSH